MDGSLVLHHDENEDGNPDEIMARRLKNRERQRRYRARKRQEADHRKSSIHDQSTPPMHHGQMMMPTELLSVPVEVEVSVNLTSPDHVTRVHCPRDWKKDARTAHVHKKRELSPAGSSAAFLECEVKEDSQLEYSNTPVVDSSNATHGFRLSGRHWKAEARNKKQVENERDGVTGVCL